MNTFKILLECSMMIKNGMLHNHSLPEKRYVFQDVVGRTEKTFVTSLLLFKISRTVHAAFKLTLDIYNNKSPVCTISKTSGITEIIRMYALWCIIEILRQFFEIKKYKKQTDSTRGIAGVLPDFRQILTVIPKGNLLMKFEHSWNLPDLGNK